MDAITLQPTMDVDSLQKLWLLDGILTQAAHDQVTDIPMAGPLADPRYRLPLSNWGRPV